ncbi:MAG: ABC transporter permease [Gammaproteobacteria bacterium]
MRPGPVSRSLLLLAGLRFYLRHPGQLGLTVAGIALGVATVVAIDLAAFSSAQAFEASTRLFRGQATHEISRPGDSLPDDLLARVRRDFGIATSAPTVEGRLRLAIQPRRSISLIGIDPLSAARVGGAVATFAPGAANFPRLMTQPATVLVSAEVAQELGIDAGDELKLLDAGGGKSLSVIGLVPGASGERFLLADIATAQEVLRRAGQLTRIDLRLTADQAALLTAQLRQEGLQLRPVAATLGQVDAMTRSFRINLQALSLLALLVGAFLVFSTVSFSVVRRREMFGLFRSLGARRREVLQLVLTEILVLAAAGVALGLLGGIVLGSGLVNLVLRTIGDLYLSTSVDYFGVSAPLLIKAALIGFGASLGAAAWPAIEAARAPPRRAMLRAYLERRNSQAAGSRLLVALLLAGGASVLLLFTADLRLAFVAIFMALIAAAVATPTAVQFSMQGLAAASAWLPLSYAARSVSANLSRTGPAVAALMIAVATFSGVGLMIGSFRLSVDEWLSYSLDADVLVRPTDTRALAASGEEADLLAELRRLPGVVDLSLSRRRALPDGEGIATLLAVQPAAQGRWPQSAQPRARVLTSLAQPDRVLVSEPFARKRGLAEGDGLSLLTPGGTREFSVAATFVDYSTDLGLVAMPLDRYRQLFGDQQVDTIGVFAGPGQSANVLAQVEGLADRRGDLRVTTSEFLRELSLLVFDRTFTITQVLRLIAGLVAVIAVVNALQAQRLDSRREIATLRALGFSPGQVLRLGEMQSLLLGAAAGVLAVPVGILMAWLLIVVVNRIAFGWSMVFVVDWWLLSQGVLLAAGAGLLAGWLPNRRSLRESPAAALRAY